MTEWDNSKEDKEVFLIEIGEKRCKVSPFLSITDIQLVIDKVQENKDIDYKMIVAGIIANHTRGTFDPSEIIEQDDGLFEKYIDKCVAGDSRLKDNYESLELLDKNERFVLAVDSTGKQVAKELSETLKKAVGPVLSKAAESRKSIQKNLVQAIAPQIKVLETINAIAATWQFTWAENLKTIAESYRRMIPDYSKMFSGISSALQKLVNNIHISTITEEEKKQLIKSYTEWGKLGWTLPPNAELNIFNREPQDAKDAYQRLRRYINDSDIDDLFNDIRQLKHIKKSDFDEAVNCFKTGNNKACALILFSLIDSRLIRSQLDNERRRGMRLSGKQAAAKLFGRIESKYLKESMLFTMLHQVNILAALETIFDSGRDFKVQPKVINRNFVDHGMMYRKVTRKDCIMLFLLLYNFTEHLNSFVGK